MAKRNWPGYVVAYATWSALLLVGLWLLAVAREVFLTLAAHYCVGSTMRARQVGLGDKVFVVCAGMLWLVAVVLVEAYFRAGVERRDLTRRLALVAGPELLLLFAADLTLAVLRGLGGWPRALLLVGELIAGVGLVCLARSRRTRRPGRVPLAKL